MQLELHPDLRNPIFELEPHDTVQGYADTYGDQIAEALEDNKLIYAPKVPILCDLKGLQRVKLPQSVQKFGTQLIYSPLLVNTENGISVLDSSIFHKLMPNDHLAAAYLAEQSKLLDHQIQAIFRMLFPRYRTASEHSTFRFADGQCDVHFDYFDDPMIYHRVKIFINLDHKPRIWRLGPDLFDMIETLRDRLPDPLPDTINDLNRFTQHEKTIADQPYHVLHFPILSMVIANGDTLAHGVEFGRRAIALENLVHVDSMLNPSKNPHARYEALRRAEAA